MSYALVDFAYEMELFSVTGFQMRGIDTFHLIGKYSSINQKSC